MLWREKSHPELTVRVSFEITRLGTQCLIEAYDVKAERNLVLPHFACWHCGLTRPVGRGRAGAGSPRARTWYA
jgi:hypothetical protein